MGAIASRPARPGAVIKGELFPEYGYCREDGTVLLKNFNNEVGVVVKDDGDGTWTPIANAAAIAVPLTGAVAIVVDTGIYDDADITATPTDRTTSIMTKGPAIIALKNATLGDGSLVSVLSAGNLTILSGLFEALDFKIQDSL